MLFNGFPSFSTAKSARPDTRLKLATPSKKPSRLQSVLRALRLSRPQPKVEERCPPPLVTHMPAVALHVCDYAVGVSLTCLRLTNALPLVVWPPCPPTHQGTTLSASARPSAASIPLSIPHSTFLTTDSTRLTLPRSAATAPAISYSNPPAASAPTVPLPITYLVAATRRIGVLESTVSQLEFDNARQVSDTNALFDEKLYPRMMAFAKERDDEKAARELAEDRLAEVIASHAKMEDVILKERERHRKAERARLEACSAKEKKNADLQAVLLDLQARIDFLNVEELQKSLVRLGIVDPDDQQYPLTYPVCGDCIAPFLKSVCAEAKRGTNSGDGGEQKQELELARAGHQAFEGVGR